MSQVSSFELGITRVVPQRAAGQGGDAATHAVDWRFDIRLWHWHGYGVVGRCRGHRGAAVHHGVAGALGWGKLREVIRDGLRALIARDRAVDNWLVQEVAPAYDALKADPGRADSVEQVRERLAAQHKLITNAV